MGEVAEMKPKEDEPEQLGLFEGEPIHALKASLSAAGFMDIDTALKKSARVSITGEGYVSKVIFSTTKQGITVRQHVIVVDNELTTIAPVAK